jgi:antirestriction protein ArdC
MRLMEGRYQEAVGVWQPAEGRIIVKRSQLQSLADFAATILHELSHALSGAPDLSLEFEQQLTAELGAIVARNLTNV